MEKVKTKKKWFLVVVTAMCLSIALVIPLYAFWDTTPVCPPDGQIHFFPFPGNRSYFWACDGHNRLPHLMRCPDGLYFCPEIASCTWHWGCTCC